MLQHLDVISCEDLRGTITEEQIFSKSHRQENIERLKLRQGARRVSCGVAPRQQ